MFLRAEEREMTKQAAIKNYRQLVALQAKLPANRQWELGAAIKAAKAQAYVEIEAAQVRK
jgi:hypothetical protein